MKKVISKSVLFLTILIVLSACVSTSKMKNRHYQRWGETSNYTIEENENSEGKSIVYIEPTTSLENKILNESIEITSTKDKINEIDLNENATNNSNGNIGKSKLKKTKIDDSEFSLSDFKFKNQLKSSLFPSLAPASGDLSLLWIIIIILLILWALGFISGNFGGLVHLLLVIALILLILWLLRII